MGDTGKKILFVMSGTKVAEKIKRSFAKLLPDVFVIHSAGTAEALSRCEKNRFDLIVSDYYLPNVNGLEFLKVLKRNGNNTPFILIVDFQSQALIIDALKAGAFDTIIYDPAFEDIVPIVVKKNLDYISTKQELESLKSLLKHTKYEAEESFIYDKMTFLYNRKFMIKRLEDENNRAKRYNRPFCVFLIDIDRLAEINKNYGKKSGDVVIQKTASIIKKTLRKTDVIGRYLDDEFLVILPETPIEKASLVAKKIIGNINGHTFHAEGKEFKVSISIGAGWYPRFGKEDYEELLSSAGKALIKAKKDGGNKIKISGMYDMR